MLPVWMPYPWLPVLPEMRLRASGVVPPIVVEVEEAAYTPMSLASATVPPASVPMKLPSISVFGVPPLT